MESMLLVRHAFAGSNRDRIASCAVPGEGLTSEGVEQARLLATRFADQEIALGVASELARTQETLELVLGGRAVRRLVVGDLNEIEFGSFADGPLDEYRVWAASHSPAEPAPGGGEPGPRASCCTSVMHSPSGTWSMPPVASSRRLSWRRSTTPTRSC